jgi:acyl-CoA synthetase (AMP-forming)/AMP-acid ligase II
MRIACTSSSSRREAGVRKPAGTAPGGHGFDLTSLRGVLYGASPMTRAVLERAMKALPGASFTQAYGMTELAPVATLLSPADHEAGHLLSAGRAAPHAEIRVVDPHWGERVHAVIVLRPGATLTHEELRAHAKSLIAGYKAPRSLAIVDRLPVSGTGKVLKRELRRAHWGDQERQVH